MVLASGGSGGSHIATLLVELGAILLALGILGRVARWVHIPVVPLYLVAGLFFGQGGLVSLSASQDFLRVSADIGVVLLLVMLGLEYSAAELKSSLRTQAPIGVLDGLLNAVPGAAIALLAGWGGLAAVTLAGVTWVSSSGVIAKMLGDLRPARQPRDPGDPRRARRGRPDDGAVPAAAHGAPRRRRRRPRSDRRGSRVGHRRCRHRARDALRRRT